MILTHTLQKLLENNPEKNGFRQHFLTLYAIIMGVEASSVLETGAGFSTLVILAALEDLQKAKGALISVDKRPIEETLGKLDLCAIGLELSRLTYIQGHFAQQYGELSEGVYDVFLHDGSHTVNEVAVDLKCILPRMRQNGLILVHDTLGIMTNHNVLFGLEGDFEYVTLPYGYGLTIIRVLEDFGHGSINPRWRKL